MTFEASTSLRKLAVSDFGGQGRVQNEFGDVVLQPGSALKANLTVVNKSGEITLVVPEDANFKLTAQATGGEVISDFGSPRKGAPVLNSTVGKGGPQIRLQTTHAPIRIKKN